MLIPKVEGRIEQYLAFLQKQSFRRVAGLTFELYETEQTLRLPPEGANPGAKDAVWKKISAPAPWGREWACGWFRAVYTAPKTDAALFLSVTPNADSLVFIDGKPAGAFNPCHKELRVPADGGRHTLHIEAYGGHWQGGCGPFEGASIILTIGKTLPTYPNTFEGGCLLERREAVYALYYDVRALFSLAKKLDDSGAAGLRKARILKGLFDALMEEVSFNTLPPAAGTAAGEAEAGAGAELERQALAARARIAPLLAAKNGDTVPKVYMAGHAHIDHAWLWHIGETERKAARTWANMCRFAGEYPEFVFLQSQPCQLEIVKNEYPAIFDEIKTAFKNGRWEPNGGMWVEADCNIPSGESLIRQFLVGKAFTREAFAGILPADYEPDTLWLPDVFGYAAALPQILAGCRIKYFVTSKIGWNDTTRFPYETFIWRGIDGTGIKTHFVSSKFTGYNGKVEPEELISVWNDVQHKELQGGFIRSIGEGDGGGGTFRSDLEMARRFANLEGMPQCVWTPVSRALDELFSEPVSFPEWRGELYLELHRGTYTTQARTKRGNRRVEAALRNAEWLLAVTGGAAREAQAALLAIWKRVLTHQFHDIIPGSSIRRVYEEAESMYAESLAALDALTLPARLAALCGGGGGAAGSGDVAGGRPVVVFNSLSWRRKTTLTLPASIAAAAKNSALFPLQFYTDIDGEQCAACSVEIPPMGWSVLSAAQSVIAAAQSVPAAASPFTVDANSAETVITTPYYRVVFDRVTGRITSFADKAGTAAKTVRAAAKTVRAAAEVVREGGFFNNFITAEDVPVFWSAWDIDSDWTKSLREETRLISSAIAADGPVCLRLRQSYRLSPKSALTQDIVFYAQNRRVDFETKVDWHERQRLLKVEFDTNVFAPQVRCEVQYGHIFRGTTRNLPHDRAKFEMCAHKWVALEEAGGGVALLNDCKYGFDVEGGRIRLSLLRSSVAPDPEADQGEHRFTYALLPFSGGFGTSGVIQAAYDLNTPLMLTASPAGVPAAASPAASPAGAVTAVPAGAAAAASPAGAVAGAAAAARPADFSFCWFEPGAGETGVSGVSGEPDETPPSAMNPVIIECVKPAEDGNGIIIRLYESLGGKARTRLCFAQTVTSASETDMLEGNPRPLPVSDNKLPLELRPFEIKTIRVLCR